jgi:hypothetical protein
VNFLVEPKKGTKWPSKLPRFSTRHEAIAVCKELCKNQYLLRSEKRGKGELDVRYDNRLFSWWFIPSLNFPFAFRSGIARS